MAIPRRSRGHAFYPLVPPLPVLESVTSGPPPFRGTRNIPELAEDAAELEAAVERDGHRDESRVGLAGGGVRAQGLGVREDVVGDDQRTRLELRPRELEQPLVVLLLRVEEDDVEHVVDAGERLER